MGLDQEQFVYERRGCEELLSYMTGSTRQEHRDE